MKLSWIVTFGSGHLGGFGLGYYLPVYTKDGYVDEMEVRRIVCSMFESKWSMLYSAEEWKPEHGEKPLGIVLISANGTWSTRTNP